jgi:penicillin-binding protein 1C
MKPLALLRRYPHRSAAAALGVALFAAMGWIRLGPIPADLLDDRGSSSTLVSDRNGLPLYEALSTNGTRSVKLSANDLPATMVAATVAVEDHRFWSHPGIDVVAMTRALKRNLSERQVVEGGSTISQQVAKLLLSRRSPSRRREFGAKIHEAILALRLEHRFSKREILSMYLNLAGYGNQMVGVERASRAYFGSPASMLTPAQAAFLAGLPQRPSGFNPYRSRESAVRRQRGVLRRMETLGTLSAEQAREAHAEQLTFKRPSAPFSAPHFVEMVLAKAGDARPSRIRTTLDGGLQADVAGILQTFRPVLEKHGAANVAVVVLENATGHWLAWEGSGDYFDGTRGGTINGPRALRQPGSALKPFTYALAFEQGFTPASVLPDIPSHFPTPEEGVLYAPRNYDGRYRGPMLARRALAGSENVPAVALASELGVPSLIRFLQRAGLTTFDRNASYYGLGVTLGNAEVRLDELVGAYAALARGGEWMKPASVFRDDERGQPERRRLVSRRTAFWIGDVLSDPEAREFIFGRGGSLEFPFPVAVKTGTSQAYHDNWTVGYTRAVTVGVWVGNFDRKPLRQSSGVTGAAPIFHAVMLAAEKRFGGTTEILLHADDSVVEEEVCSLSGALANEWCPSKQREWLASDGEEAPCGWHHLADEGLLVVWPAEYRQWAKQNGRLADPWRYADKAFASKASSAGSTVAPARRVALEITNPPSGATYLIDPTLRREFQTLPLRVVASRPGRIVWSVDGQPAGESSSDAALMWPLTPGAHYITARDEQGRSAETTVIVK